MKTSLSNRQLNDVLSGIKAGILSVRGTIPGMDVLGTLIEKVDRGAYAKSDTKALVGYGYKVGRTWAIGAFRHKKVLERGEEQLGLHAEVTHLNAAIRNEFYDLALNLGTSAKTGTQLAQLDVLGKSCMEGYSTQALRKAYPGVSENLIEQWKRRGFKRMYPLASPALREVLSLCRTGHGFTAQLSSGEPVIVYSGLRSGYIALKEKKARTTRRKSPRLAPPPTKNRRRTSRRPSGRM
jgi:hypothetical protein